MLAVHPLAGRLKIAATYRIVQPIENLVLRVKIVEQKSPLAELFESEGETQDHLLVEERNVRWQEKMFSPREMKFYADEKNCTSDLHEEYRRVILDEEAATDKSRIYTYTQRDSYYADKSILTTNYVTNLARRNENAIPVARNLKPFAKRYNKKVVETRPSKSLTRSSHCLYKNCTCMHILVDLSSKDDRLDDNANDNRDRALVLSPDSQILLCTITHDRAAGTLTIDPDITNEDDRYTLETTDLLYDYWIEHVSIQPSDDLSKQRQLLHRETREKRAYREEQVFREVAVPPGNILRSFVNLEIVSAREFPYEPLFVTYYVDLPRHWTSSETERLTGRTQRCRVVEGNANFAYVSEIPLDFDLNSLKTTNGQQPRAWPYFIFTVGSIDHWTRYRIEGYASVPLPPSPGSYSFDLTTWRPLGRFVNALRRFFTGGTSELEDPTYCGILSENDDSKRLEKCRLRVTPGGSIKINLNIVRQSKIFINNHSLCRDSFERLSTGTLINSLDNVLEQFKAARDRMIHARAQ